MTEITAHHGLFKVTNLHVHDTGGSGRPVVLVHGWPLSGEAFSEQVLPLVAANVDAVPPGRGCSAGEQRPVRGLQGDPRVAVVSREALRGGCRCAGMWRGAGRLLRGGGRDLGER